MSSGDERASTLLSVVSAAAARMLHDVGSVPSVAVRAAIDLGHDVAAFRVLDQDSIGHRTLESHGLDEDPEDPSTLPGTMADLVLQRGELVVARREPTGAEARLPDAAPGLAAAVAAPIWIEGWIAAVLIGAATEDGRVTPDVVEAFGILAAQAGLGLENAQRIEEGRQAAGRLEQGDRLKTSFLTTISHELRTPLTALTGSGLVLEHTWAELGEEDRLALIRSMNENARELDGMLTDLLDHARLEAGELWVSFEPFDVSRTVRTVCAHAQPGLGNRSLRLDVEDGVLASGDAVMIRRVIGHLVANAITHTPDGSTIQASVRHGDGDVIVELVDDGDGIAEEDLPFLGERFFRGGDPNDRARGLGLGLALAHGILELHGSALVIENREGGGARFAFRLPAAADPAAPSPSVSGAHPESDGSRHGRT